MKLACDCGCAVMGCIDIMPLQGKRKYTHLLCYLMICTKCGGCYIFRPDAEEKNHQLHPINTPEANKLISDAEVEIYTGNNGEF